jgi:hypothetical protein
MHQSLNIYYIKGSMDQWLILMHFSVTADEHVCSTKLTFAKTCFFYLYGIVQIFLMTRRDVVNWHAVLRIRTRDPVLFYPKYPGSESGMIFFGIPDPGSLPRTKFKILL